MAPPRKPHPRSLDALFPIPPITRCLRGHSQTPGWTGPCSTCDKDEAEFARRQWERTDERKNYAKVERLTELAKLTPLPDPYVMWTHDGTRQVFHAARGPRRGRPIRRRA